MLKRALIALALSGLIAVTCQPYSTLAFSDEETGNFSIYFMDEKVGYEEYTWLEDEYGFLLSVRGRMTKPIQVDIDSLKIRLDKSYVPSRFEFNGTLGGMTQNIVSIISEGRVENVLRVAGQEQRETIEVRRDAFLLPNPIFSPYMVITKKFHCDLEENMALAAYIIPQMEAAFTLETKEENPCTLVMQMSTAVIELETDEKGRLHSVLIPSQKLHITRD
jgi:hypothetical protein